MSDHSLLGAIAVPPEVADPFSYWDPKALRFAASSRNGWFQFTCGKLLDEISGHEALRFLAAQTCTRESPEREGRTMLTVLDQATIGVVIAQLDDLLAHCKDNTELLSRKVFATDGWSVSDIQAALSSALDRREFTKGVTDGGEDDSPAFLFSVFTNLRALFNITQQQRSNVVYFNWVVVSDTH